MEANKLTIMSSIKIWNASPDEPQGIYKYYEQDNRLSAAIVEAIFDEFIDNLGIDSLCLTRAEFEEISR